MFIVFITTLRIYRFDPFRRDILNYFDALTHAAPEKSKSTPTPIIKLFMYFLQIQIPPLVAVFSHTTRAARLYRVLRLFIIFCPQIIQNYIIQTLHNAAIHYLSLTYLYINVANITTLFLLT